MKFLCDQMLVRLGRWLRAAGYDTEIITSSEADEQVLKQARAGGRILITRDAYFTKIAENNDKIIYLAVNSLEECIKALSEFEINWLLAPFSRCLLCNSILTNDNQSIPSNMDDHFA